MRKTPQLPHGHLNPDKKTKSDVKTVTPTQIRKRITQVHHAPFTEFIGKVNEVESTKDEVRLVLTSSMQVTIHIPRKQLASESTLPKPDQFISILRTDTGYIIQTHLRNQEHHASDSSKPLTGDDIEPSLRRTCDEH